MSALHLFGAVLLGAVFTVSSWSKVHDRRARREFVTAVRGWRLAPDRFAGRVATAVATAETLTTVLLLASVLVPVSLLRVVAGLAAVVLLLALTGGLVGVLRRGLAAGCACFGASTSPVGARHVVRNVVLLVVALVATTTAAATGAPSAAAGVLAVGLAAVGALLVIRFDDLVDLFTPVPTTSGS